LQLATGRENIAPSSFRLRLLVDDIEKARQVLATKGIEAGPVQKLPSLVAFANLTDPWGNPLGIYQDLGALTPGA
jgi:hypothetical protein